MFKGRFLAEACLDLERGPWGGARSGGTWHLGQIPHDAKFGENPARVGDELHFLHIFFTWTSRTELYIHFPRCGLS